MIVRDVKVFDEKLSDFSVEVREALQRLETNLIHLNKVSINKIEKKMIIKNESSDEQSQSSSHGDNLFNDDSQFIFKNDQFKKTYLKSFTLRKFKNLEPMIAQNFQLLKEEMLKFKEEIV